MALVALIAALVAQQRSAEQRVARLNVELKRAWSSNASLASTGHVYFQSKIGVVDDRVHIAAVTELMTRIDQKYVWSIRISNSRSKQVVYTKQSESGPSTRVERMCTTFSETPSPALAPGEYRVGISLLEIPHGMGLSALDDDKDQEAYAVGSSTSRVTIAPGE